MITRRAVALAGGVELVLASPPGFAQIGQAMRQIGLSIPQTVLLRADEVVQ